MAHPDLCSSKEAMEEAASFMVSNCPSDLAKQDYFGQKFGQVESCANFLVRRGPRALQVARASGNLTDLWKDCWDERSKSAKDGRAQAANIVQEVRDLMQQLVKGDLDFFPWPPEDKGPTDDEDRSYIATLALKHNYLKGSSPRIQIHDLGSFRRDPVLNAPVQDLFSGRNTFLVNTSGSGKTRLLYEGLCQNWGFYFTGAVDVTGLGSKDVDMILGTAMFRQTELGFCSLPDDGLPGLEQLSLCNKRAVWRRFSEMLLARLLLFREFLQQVALLSLDDNEEDFQRRWLLLQLHTPILNVPDIFREISRVLSNVAEDYLRETIPALLVEVRSLCGDLGFADRLFITMDESNVLSNQYVDSFRDENGDYPILKEVLRTWQSYTRDLPITIIAAGTDIPLSDFLQDEWMNFHWSSNTGHFDTIELQSRYIARYLPPRLAETEAGQALLRRAWTWLRVRHRQTALLVTALMEQGFQSPHTLLNQVFLRLSNFQGSEDGAEWISKEPPTEWIQAKDYDPYPCEFLSADTLLRSTVHEILFHYIATGEHPPYFGYDRVGLVSRILGRFVDTEMQQIAIDEPITLCCAMKWFIKKYRSKKTYEQFLRYFQHSTVRRPYSPTTFICIYLLYAMQSRPLSSVFRLLAADSTWAEHEAQLVVMSKQAESGICSVDATEANTLLSGPNPLAFNAQTRDDVLAWLRHERNAAFCICPSNCSANLLFVVRIQANYMWVALKTTGGGHGAYYTVTPDLSESLLDNLFPQKLFRAKSTADLVSAIVALPNSDLSSTKYPLLRVIASFPNEPEIASATKKLADAPAACLDLKLFKQITKSIPHNNLALGLWHGLLRKPRVWETVEPERRRSSRVPSLPKQRNPVSKSSRRSEPLHMPPARANKRLSATDPSIAPSKRAKSEPPSVKPSSASKPSSATKPVNRSPAKGLKRLSPVDEDEIEAPRSKRAKSAKPPSRAPPSTSPKSSSRRAKTVPPIEPSPARRSSRLSEGKSKT
ncbi:hypothetical protein C8J56DRAFT_424675 [Mycena floridula]|nr:hypothetical protein C8J56DRAFT_424675 [Mycena floridula]